MNTSPKKIFSWKLVGLLFVSAGLLVVGFTVFLPARIQTVKGFFISETRSTVVTPKPIGFGSSFVAPSQPARLRIPTIGVDAIVQGVGLSRTGNGAMGIPTNFKDVAWYSPGTIPGMPGSAVIDGHLDGRNVQEAVFYNLQSLKPGDLVEVLDSNGKTLQFRVVDKKIYDYDAPTAEIFSSDTSKARLNLITCTGSWIKSQKLYNKRVVVFTELVTQD